MATIQRSKPNLSCREAEIVELSIQGLTNETIAHRLGISVGTVNTYWLRIRMKVGGLGRTDTVAKILAARSEMALREANKMHEQELAETSGDFEDSHSWTVVALLRMIATLSQSIVWAVDRNLDFCLVEDEIGLSNQTENCSPGCSIREFFKDRDPDGLGVMAHLQAVSGIETSVQLRGEFKDLNLHTVPLTNGRNQSMGCIGILGRQEYRNLGACVQSS